MLNTNLLLNKREILVKYSALSYTIDNQLRDTAQVKEEKNLAQVSAIILAAGKGTRMKSQLPKVLHKVSGQSMVQHVLNAVEGAGVTNPIVVIGHGAQLVKEMLGDRVSFALQAEQLGTGHAAMQTKDYLDKGEGNVIVLCGDTPLITQETIAQLLADHTAAQGSATVLTAILEDPTGYGRIVRSAAGLVEGIVEHKDATDEQRDIQEVNTGVYCFKTPDLFAALEQITPANAQGEYYLTDVLGILKQEGKKVGATVLNDPDELMGINDRAQLAVAERLMRQRINHQVMMSGVTIIDPSSTFIDAGVRIEPDTIIHPFTFIQGQTTIGSSCNIGPGSRLVNAVVADEVEISNSIVLDSSIGAQTVIGPYAYIRPGTQLAENVKVGDFVEIKKSVIGKGSKVPHLSYIGDSHIGQGVNIGAGTITCNYDGHNKYPTIIGDGAFIGSNSNLVAPVEIGEGAMTAAGSTITKNVPANSLGVARNKQTNLQNWVLSKNKEQ